MGIAAFVCLTLSCDVLESFEAKNNLEWSIERGGTCRDLVTVATTITKGLLSRSSVATTIARAHQKQNVGRARERQIEAA